LGNLGGITEILFTGFAIFIKPMSMHSFTLKAMKKLYFAKKKRK
jgi:hypothetical protein